MKLTCAAAGLLLALAFPAYAIPAGKTGTTHHSSTSSAKPKVYVNGYYRKDGTYVPPHWRAASGAGHSTTASSGSTSSHHGGCQTCPRDANGKIIRSQAARDQFMRQTGYPHGRPGYVVDHIVPLECGGADSPSNMQWQTVAEAKSKDKTEANCRH
jgi:hypothetical protein